METYELQIPRLITRLTERVVLPKMNPSYRIYEVWYMRFSDPESMVAGWKALVILETLINLSLTGCHSPANYV